MCIYLFIYERCPYLFIFPPICLYFITFCLELFSFDYNPTGLAAPGSIVPGRDLLLLYNLYICKINERVCYFCDQRLDAFFGHLGLNYFINNNRIYYDNASYLSRLYTCDFDLLRIQNLILKHWNLFFFYPSELGIIYGTNPQTVPLHDQTP